MKSIHQLLQKVKAISKIPSMDDDEQLALFKLNWLMMNALYQLQMALLPSAYYLHISTLELQLYELDLHEIRLIEQNNLHLTNYSRKWFPDICKGISRTTYDISHIGINIRNGVV